MVKVNTSNPLNQFEYLGKKRNDKKKTFETLPRPEKVERIVINKKTYIERKIN